MSQHTTRALRFVGSALIAAGAAMAAIGTTFTEAATVAIVPVFGASLVAAGALTVLRTAEIGATRSIVMGAAMVAAGVVAAVAGFLTGNAGAVAVVPAMGAAIALAGIAAIIDGAHTRAVDTALQ